MMAHTHPFNGPLSVTTWVSRYQKGTTSLDFTEARDSEWQWHQLRRLYVCISLQTDNDASTHHSVFFTGRMPFLPPNQQRQGTEGMRIIISCNTFVLLCLSQLLVNTTLSLQNDIAVLLASSLHC